MKKILSLLLTLILVFACAFSVSANEANIISLGRIGVTMPEINVEIKGKGYNKNDITASLDSKSLTVGSVKAYDKASDSTCAYILVDLSTSMQGSFELVKKNIVKYISEMSVKDKLILITFGETEVKTVLDGSEDRDTATNAVKKLKCNENGTLFYEALSRAYQLSTSANSSFDREYVIAFSDGIDVQKGNTTFDEVIKEYDSHALPLYAACSNNASKAAADKFGEMARASGGSISMIKNAKVFDEFLKEINDVTIVKLLADTNYADGKEQQLSIKVGASQVDYNVPIIRSLEDKTAPTVKKVKFDAEKDAFVINFSEKVIGADKESAYKIVNSKGNEIAVSSVFYSEKDDAYEIKTKDTIYKGEYEIKFSGITDDSKEKNAITQEKTVKVTKTKGFRMPLWAIILIIALVLLSGGAVVLIILLSKKKNTTNQPTAVPATPNVDMYNYQSVPNSVKHHIKTNDAIRIKLRIKTGKTAEQNIETSIVSSLIVGRSDTCDVYIDDAKLSRQHFVIENDNGDFYVCDLQSRNGTLLNGIRINSRQRIKSGDKILAGLSDIVITIVGR